MKATTPSTLARYTARILPATIGKSKDPREFKQIELQSPPSPEPTQEPPTRSEPLTPTEPQADATPEPGTEPPHTPDTAKGDTSHDGPTTPDVTAGKDKPGTDIPGPSERPVGTQDNPGNSEQPGSQGGCGCTQQAPLGFLWWALLCMGLVLQKKPTSTAR